MKDNLKITFYALGIIGCLVYPLVLLSIHSALICLLPLPGNLSMVIWLFDRFWLYRWILCSAAILLFLVTYISLRRSVLSQAGEKLVGLQRAFYVFMPVCILPLIVPVFLFLGQIPNEIVANTIFFLPILVFSLIIFRALKFLPLSLNNRRYGLKTTLIIILGMSLVYALLGIYFTKTIGAHSGDEGHYIILAESLYNDKDLDIKNDIINKTEIGKELAEKIDYHISFNSRNGHWYSWHPFGLSLLLAPFVPGGIIARHAILGIIAGLGCGAMFLLCRQLGAKFVYTIAALFFFCFSVYWGVYSARCLPEVLGATLLLWLLWSFIAQFDYPWRTVLIAALCCSYLPWAQTRFLPLSFLGIGLFGLFGLYRRESFKLKAARLGLFLLLCCIGYVVYYGVQNRMFIGGVSYVVKNLLFSYPAGAWGVIASSSGILYTLPIFLWLFCAQIVWFIYNNKSRFFAISVLGMFFAILLTSCTNPWYAGGASLSGRYLLVAIPIMLPGAAIMLERVNKVARWWFLFLGAISVTFMLLLVIFLPDFGKSFGDPPQSLPRVLLFLQGLLNPYHDPRSLLSSNGPMAPKISCTSYVALALIGTFLLVMMRREKRILSIMLVVIICSAAITSHILVRSHRVRIQYSKCEAAEVLSKLDLEHIWVPRPVQKEPLRLLDLSDRFADVTPEYMVSVTTEDLGVRMEGNLVSQPNLEENDWNGRGYSWTTLIVPFDPGEGCRIFCLRGLMQGKATPVFALREGSRTILERPLIVGKDGQINVQFSFLCRGGSGRMYILIRLKDGEGTFIGQGMDWTPYSERLLQQANLVVPENLIYNKK